MVFEGQKKINKFEKKLLHKKLNAILLASDIIPKFTKHPISTSSNTTGGPMEITGCKFQSRIPLGKHDQIFYLINNLKKEFVPIGNGNLKFPTSDGFLPGEILRIGEHFFSSSIPIIPYKRETTSFEDQGFYQCGITINGPSISRTILSETTDVQFSGL